MADIDIRLLKSDAHLLLGGPILAPFTSALMGERLFALLDAYTALSEEAAAQAALITRQDEALAKMEGALERLSQMEIHNNSPAQYMQDLARAALASLPKEPS